MDENSGSDSIKKCVEELRSKYENVTGSSRTPLSYPPLELIAFVVYGENKAHSEVPWFPKHISDLDKFAHKVRCSLTNLLCNERRSWLVAKSCPQTTLVLQTKTTKPGAPTSLRSPSRTVMAKRFHELNTLSKKRQRGARCTPNSKSFTPPMLVSSIIISYPFWKLTAAMGMITVSPGKIDELTKQASERDGLVSPERVEKVNDRQMNPS